MALSHNWDTGQVECSELDDIAMQRTTTPPCWHVLFAVTGEREEAIDVSHGHYKSTLLQVATGTSSSVIDSFRFPVNRRTDEREEFPGINTMYTLQYSPSADDDEKCSGRAHGSLFNQNVVVFCITLGGIVAEYFYALSPWTRGYLLSWGYETGIGGWQSMWVRRPLIFGCPEHKRNANSFSIGDLRWRFSSLSYGGISCGSGGGGRVI